jgi:hypothetical protein
VFFCDVVNENVIIFVGDFYPLLYFSGFCNKRLTLFSGDLDLYLFIMMFALDLNDLILNAGNVLVNGLEVQPLIDDLSF